MLKKTLKALALSLSLLLAGNVHAFKIGVTAGPHAVIMEKVKQIAQEAGLSVEIVEFNDFILPNAALAQGDLDMNCYQHQPFLDEQVQARGYKLVSVGKTLLMPLGIYSKTLTSLENVPEKARVAIPNDPTNGGRALLVLQKAGLIQLKDVKNPTLNDMEKNPKQLEIMEIEAPQVPRALDEVALALINTDWVVVSGMKETPLFQEGADSPYTNILVTRQGDEGRADIKTFISCYQSDAVRAFIVETFKGAVLPAW